MKPWEEYQTNKEEMGPWTEYQSRIETPKEIPKQPQLSEEAPQPKIGALKPNPQFSDEPDYSGLPVGVPRQGAEILGKIGAGAVYPMTKVLESQELFTGEDPFSFGQKQASILDMSGHAFRGALRQGGASEVLIDDITKREDFGDSAEMIGRVITQFGAESAFVFGAARLLAGIGSIRPFQKSVDTLRKNTVATVRTTMEKAVRPRGAKNLAQKEAYYEKGTDSAIDIVKKKNDITLTKNGVDVKGELPETLGEWEQANYQARKAVVDKYTSMSTKADELKYQGDVDGLIKNLEMFIEKPSHQHGAPEMVKYAKETLDDLKYAKTNNQIAPKYMEEMIQIKNQNLRQRMNTPETKVYQSAKVDEMYNGYMNKILGDTIEKMGKGEGSKYRDLRRLFGAHKQVSQDISNAATRLAHQQPNTFQKGIETFTGYHFLRGIASKNPATIFAAGSSKGINAIETILGKPNRKVRKMFQAVESASKKIDALTPIVQKTSMPKVPPKQIGWDGTWTRKGSGETIHLGPEEYVPSGLMRANIGGARSAIPGKVPSERQPRQLLTSLKEPVKEKNIYKPNTWLRTETNKPTALLTPEGKLVKSSTPSKPKTTKQKVEGKTIYVNKRGQEQTIYKDGKSNKIGHPLAKPSKEYTKSSTPSLRPFIGKDGRIKLPKYIR